MSFCFNTQFLRFLSGSFIGLWFLAAAHCGEIPVNNFYAPSADLSAQLPADGIFPQGRKLAFMGYSGEPARDLTNGFTAAGPVYGNQLPFITRCVSNGWPVVVHVGLPIKFLTARSAADLPTKAAVQQEIQKQVREFAGFKEVVWWALIPEELRPWRFAEMDYLKTA
jgi:hypothetical protein